MLERMNIINILDSGDIDFIQEDQGQPAVFIKHDDT